MVFSALSHILIQVLEKQLDDPSGNRLDAYDIESSHERSDVLRDLQEFQFAAVS